VTSLSPWSIRYEDQPIAGGSDQYQLVASNATSFRVGGNGLRPGSTPSFAVQSSNGNYFQFNGRSAGSNCVANETNAYVPLRTQPGEVWTVTANYDAGNSGRAVRGQSHFQVTFVAPPPPPEPVYPDPNPYPCSYDLLCY
jgi:hypothetical protein